MTTKKTKIQAPKEIEKKDLIDCFLDLQEYIIYFTNRIDFLEAEVIGLQRTIRNIIETKQNQLGNDVIIRDFPFDINKYIEDTPEIHGHGVRVK